MLGDMLTLQQRHRARHVLTWRPRHSDGHVLTLQQTFTAGPQPQLCSTAWQAQYSLHPLQLIACQARQASSLQGLRRVKSQVWLLAMGARGSQGSLTTCF